MQIRKLVTVLILSFAFGGCIKEDLSQCPKEENVTFLFSYDGKRGVEFSSRIGQVDLFLFDGDGKFLLYRSATTAELDADNPSMSFVLDPGTYYALAWANVGDNSAYKNLTPGVTSLDECLVEINPASTDTGDPVYYAPRKARLELGDTRAADMNIYEVVVPAHIKVEKPLDFVRAHRSIYVWIRGFQDDGAQNPMVEAEGLWSSYDFSYRTLDDRRDYLQQAGAQTMNGASYVVAVFHHAYGSIDNEMNVLIIRTSNGEVSYTVNIRQFLEENPTSSTDDIHIMLTFSFDLGVTVSLPQWLVKPIEPGVD